MAEENSDKTPQKKKRTWIKLLVVLALLGLVALGATWGYFSWAASSPVDDSGQAAQVVFTVPKGASASGVGKKLADEGLIRSALVWKVHLKLHGGPAPTAGKHKISAGMNVPEILAALSGSPLIEDVSVTMVEGWRLRDADKILAGKGLIAAGDFVKIASKPSKFKIPFEHEGPSLTGYLLPDTYRVPVLDGKVVVERLVQIQMAAFDDRYAKPYADEIKKSGRSLRELVILASLLEREEPKPSQRPAVAGVMYKRLDSNTPLGVDATSRYTLENWNDRKAFLKKLRNPSDPYNTRLRKGLPPGPIGAPSLDSLIAALRPKMGPYWYYLHDKDGNIHFGRNHIEHEANRRKYNVW